MKKYQYKSDFTSGTHPAITENRLKYATISHNMVKNLYFCRRNPDHNIKNKQNL